MDYYFADGDQQKGPYPPETLREQGLKPDSLVWREGMGNWERADSVAELRGVFNIAGDPDQPASAPQPTSSPAPPYAPSPASYSPSYPSPTGPDYGQQLSYGGYATATGPPPTGMAIASMVLGIVAIPTMLFYCLGFPCAIIAIVLGHITRGRVRRGVAGGDGMALAGLICGYVSLLLALAGVVFIGVMIGISAGRHP